VKSTPGWCGFEEHPAGVAEQPPGGAEHEGDDEQGGDGVGAAVAGGHDDHTGDQGRDERERVGEDVLERAFDVEAGPVGLGEDPRRREVDDHAEGGHGDDRGPTTGGGSMIRRIAS